MLPFFYLRLIDDYYLISRGLFEESNIFYLSLSFLLVFPSVFYF